MGLFERLGGVVKAEWNARFPTEKRSYAERERASNAATGFGPPRRRRAVADADAAARILEVPKGASLEEVRAAYFQMAKRYHPRSHSSVPDQAHAAQTLLYALTDALEVLEEHLVPLPDPHARTKRERTSR